MSDRTTTLCKLDAISALIDKVDGPLPARTDGRLLWQLNVTRTERNLIADALTVLYGVEKRALTTGNREAP